MYQTITSKDGTRIALDRSGSGPAVILVGGAFSYRRFPKNVELARLLSNDFTVINYDRRGRGDSGDAEPYAVQREIEDLHCLIESCGGSASLWGWSSGANLALLAAAQLPVHKLVLYEPPLILDDRHPVPTADLQDRLQGLVDAGRRSAAVKLYMTEGMGAPAIFVYLMRLSPVWSRLKEVAHTLPYDWSIVEPNLRGLPLPQSIAANVTAQTLVLSGEKTAPLLKDAARALTAALPVAQHRELRAQSHNPAMAAQAPLITEFLAT